MQQIRADNGIKGLVFDIQRYCIEDGPGIRTTVFLKGCPLHCRWCSNPESQEDKIELMYKRLSCTFCGTCIEVCKKGAPSLIGDRIVTDRLKCDGCGDCVAACLNGARQLTGYWVKPDEVAEKITLDSLFYTNSGGGVTFSGGEPLHQAAFTAEVFRLCQRQGIHRAIDTCGYASEEDLLDVLKFVDLVLFDIKHMDSEWHRKYTGVGNERILSNARLIGREGLRTIIRYPVIPDFNDNLENVVKTAKFVTSLGNVEKVEFLPYHDYGSEKYSKLDRSYEWQVRRYEPETLDPYVKLMREHGVDARRIR